jgi:hypothetical protein
MTKNKACHISTLMSNDLCFDFIIAPEDSVILPPYSSDFHCQQPALVASLVTTITTAQCFTAYSIGLWKLLMSLTQLMTDASLAEDSSDDNE